MSFPTFLACALGFGALGLGAAPAPTPAEGGGTLAVRAETIHTPDEALQGGTILIEDGRIKAIGPNVTVPPGTPVVDYGPGSTIVPGFVSANSSYGRLVPSMRTADPGLLAVDNFDPYSSYVSALRGGVTTVYVPPARGRLVAGVGAVVSLSGGPGPERVLARRAALHGSISRDARNAPGYWEPPVPATVDVGLGIAQPQLPRTTMGAIVALRELVALGRGESDTDAYGPLAADQMKALLDAGVPWRIDANSEAEIRALLDFRRDTGVPVVIAGGLEAGEVAAEIAAAKVPVIVQPLMATGNLRDFGKGPDDWWPRYDAAAKLAEAGARVAIAPPDGGSAADLLVAAGLASRGGLDPAVALRAITIEPARLLGVDARVGSLAVGKDGDFVVTHGNPLAPGPTVTACYVRGETAYSPELVREARRAAASAARASVRAAAPVVIAVEHLYVGDGTVLSPGELLMHDGEIQEVGATVSRPPGARVVRGSAAMPGMIDGLGFLGTEGSRRAVPLKFDLTEIVEPGDFADRRVAKSGVTTVQLTSRGQSAQGSPFMAYKPAEDDVDAMVVSGLSGVRLKWSDDTRTKSGAIVRAVLAKAKEYEDKWLEYEKAMSEWTPPAPEAGSQEDEEAAEESSDDEDDGDDDKGKKKKKKKKKEPAKPITGVWKTKVAGPDGEVLFRLRVHDLDGELEGSLRCPLLSENLIELTGRREDRAVSLSGTSAGASFELTGESDNEGKISGKVVHPDGELEFEVEQVSTEYVIARRPERRKPESEPEPKGKPKSPGVDDDLHPFRRVFAGKAAVVVEVDREDEIVQCVHTFAQYGIEPVLLGANDAWRVADRIAGHVSGVLLSHQIVASSASMGAEFRNRYAELQAAGIPVAFHSAAEEGAAELPQLAIYAVSKGMSPSGALRALTGDAAAMFHIDGRVGTLAVGRDADVLLLDGPAMAPATSVTRVWVAGREVR